MVNRKAKIVATIGPASQDEAVLEKLVRAGMNVARLNFSHGSHDEHAAYISSLRRISENLNSPVAILQDLQGPKIRVGELSAPVSLVSGQMVRLYAQEDKQSRVNDEDIPVDFPELFEHIATGDRILLDDGRIELSVLKTGRRYLTARVRTGGILSSHKGINLPGVRMDIRSFTDKDEADLAFGLSQGVDAVAISFVRTAQDIACIRQAAEQHAPPAHLFLIAKLEHPEALENLDAIVQAADGVMVARGDLGVEMPPESVPITQKQIIQAANRSGKLVITATQMLDSMIHNPLPTRAEASDVANAILDGSDAVMLSAETASGQYPVESIAMMDKIICQAEAHFEEWGHAQETALPGHNDAAAMTGAARELAHDRDVAAIAVFTRSGRTAVLMSKARPCVPILAFSPEPTTYQRMAMLWGVIPYRVPFSATLEEMLVHVESALTASGKVKHGQQVVLLSGFPVGALCPPNMALLHTVR